MDETTDLKPEDCGRNASSPAGEQVDDLARFRRTLDSEKRDVELRRWPAGTPVLANPLAPDEFMPDTESSRRRFRELDFAWSAATRQRVWFGEPSSELRAKLSAAHSAKERFIAALDENMAAMRGQPMPDVNLPYRTFLLPWEPTVRSVEHFEEDLTAAVAKGLQRLAGAPEGVAWPRRWDEMLGGACCVKAYCLKGTWARVHVVAAFVSPLHVEPGRVWLLQPGTEVLEVVRKAYRQWLQTAAAQPQFTFFTLGSAMPWSAEVQGHAAGDHWVVVSSLTPAGAWEVRTPPRFADRFSLRNFLDSLKPETRQQRISKIKTAVDEFLLGEPGVLVPMAAEKTRYRKSVVLDAFLTLQDQAPDSYRLEKRYDGRVAVRRAVQNEPVSVTADMFRPTIARRHLLGLVGTAVGAGGWVLRDLLRGGRFDPMGISILIPIVYVASCAQAAINRRASSNKE